MKKWWISYYLTMILAIVLVYLMMENIVSPSLYSKTLLSPLPAFLSQTQNKQVTTLNIWEPLLEVFQSKPFNTHQLTAQAVLMYDLTENKVLFEKNAKKRLPMASLTKIMTAIISLEHPKEGLYTVTPAALVGEDTMGLTTGEQLSLPELLYGLMLHSGNDAAEVLAINSPYGRTGFIQAMNDKAKALGLTNTHFTNPTGLEGDGDQYTTVSDLLVITRYALSNFPLFAQIAQTPSYAISQTTTHKEFDLENETNLLTTYPGVKGIKTGYTPEAGLCLVTYLDYDRHQIIGVILGSENRRGEMKDLLDFSLTSLGIKPPKFTGS